MNLVTGGSGFIGRHIVDLLLEKEESVRVLDLDITARFPDKVEIVLGSVTDERVATKAMKGVRRVFHVAGNPQLWDRDKRSFEQINTGGTQTILKAAAEHNVERFVHTSSYVVLSSRQNGISDFSFHSEPSTDNALGSYAKSKLLAEKEVWKAIQQGLPALIVRPTLPIGPADFNETPPTKMLTDFLNGRHMAFMECDLNLIDIRDVARGHVCAAFQGIPGSAYLLGNETVQLSALLKTLEQITGVQMPRICVSYGLALVTAAISEFFADYFSRCPPVATISGVRLARRLRLETPNRDPVSLGMTLTPLQKSLVDTIDWLVTEGRIQPLQIQN